MAQSNAIAAPLVPCVLGCRLFRLKHCGLCSLARGSGAVAAWRWLMDQRGKCRSVRRHQPPQFLEPGLDDDVELFEIDSLGFLVSLAYSVIPPAGSLTVLLYLASSDGTQKYSPISVP